MRDHCVFWRYGSTIQPRLGNRGTKAKMKMITMTADQTHAYDADEPQCLSALIAQAQAAADESGQTVEIYTADGIVADVRYPATSKQS